MFSVLLNLLIFPQDLFQSQNYAICSLLWSLVLVLAVVFLFFKKSFNVDHFQSLFWSFYNIVIFLCQFFGCQGMWYYNSSIRVLTHNPCIGRWCSKTAGPIREVLLCLFKNDQFYSSSMLQIIGIHCLPISVFHLISSRTWISVILYLHQKLWFPDPTTSSIVYYLRYSYSIPWTPFLSLFYLICLEKSLSFFFFFFFLSLHICQQTWRKKHQHQNSNH